jgi:hypothetical protein
VTIRKWLILHAPEELNKLEELRNVGATALEWRALWARLDTIPGWREQIVVSQDTEENDKEEL